MMVETRPVGLWLWFLGCGCGPCYFLHHQTVFPPFNDDLGTMPTRRPYSWGQETVCALLQSVYKLDNPCRDT